MPISPSWPPSVRGPYCTTRGRDQLYIDGGSKHGLCGPRDGAIVVIKRWDSGTDLDPYWGCVHMA